MIEWLVPICLFWVLAATYLGGWPVDVEGGTGLRQVLGLVLSFVGFMLLWGLLRLALGGAAGFFGRLIIPTAVTALLLPLIAWVGFRIVGVKVVRKTAGAH